MALILVLLAPILHRSSAQEIGCESILVACSCHFRAGPDLPGKTNRLPAFGGTSAKVFQVSGGHSPPNCSRLTQPSPLQPQDKLVWGDMVEYADYGVAAGDAYAAVRLSALLGRMGKESQVRIGSHYSFADLRNSPAIVVGRLQQSVDDANDVQPPFRICGRGRGADDPGARSGGPSLARLNLARMAK